MKYAKYTKSEIPWNSDYPAHWKCDKAKRFFSSPKEINRGNVEDNVLSLTLRGVIKNSKEKPIGLSPDDYSTYQIFRPNDLVFKLIDLNNISTSRVGIVPETGIMSSAYIRFSPKCDMNIKYFYYQYFDWYKRNVFNGLGAGVRQTLSSGDLGVLSILVPPREEQDQIVRYLDWQVSRINQLIAAKKKEISVIKEQKEAVINDAVTHGIKKDRPLKDSQMNWLPQIPVEWDTIPAKALFENVSELRHEDDEMLAATQKYGIIAQKKYMEIEGRRIVLATDNLDKWLHVEPGEFIISLRSFQGGLEFCDISGCVTWHYVVLRPRREIYEPYYKWFFKCASYVGALQRTSDFIRDGQDLRYSNFAKVRLMVVPMEEQKAIAEHLNTIVPKFDSAIESIEKEIKILQEYSDRIISDVVTGQIDVRGVEIPEYEYTEEMIDDVTDEGDVSPEVDEND